MLNKALPIAAGIAAQQIAVRNFSAQLAKVPAPLWLTSSLVGVGAGILAHKFLG